MSSSQEELPKTGSPNPLQGVAEHIRALLARLHAESSAQEGSMTEGDFKDRPFAEVMKDKFIALDEDKSQYVYQLLRALGATTVVEAGTSYGVSTIYLALAVAANAAASGKAGRVIATEHEPGKCVQARKYWAECGEEVSNVIDLREGDLRETLKTDLENVDVLLLDSMIPSNLCHLVLLRQITYVCVTSAAALESTSLTIAYGNSLGPNGLADPEACPAKDAPWCCRYHRQQHRSRQGLQGPPGILAMVG